MSKVKDLLEQGYTSIPVEECDLKCPTCEEFVHKCVNCGYESCHCTLVPLHAIKISHGRVLCVGCGS